MHFKGHKHCWKKTIKMAIEQPVFEGRKRDLMPVTVERIEPHIYVSTYSSHPSIKEIIDAIEERKAIADAHQENYYVSLADLTHFKMIPFDLGKIRRAAASDTRVVRSLLVGASLQIRVLVASFQGLLGLNPELFETMDPALERARQLLSARGKTSR